MESEIKGKDTDMESLQSSIGVFLSELGDYDIYTKILLEELFLFVKEQTHGNKQ